METFFGAIVAMTLGTVLVLGASLTGQQQKLCDALGGAYTPSLAPGDVCPGGSWAKLFSTVPHAKPLETKP